MTQLREQIRLRALELGFDRCRFTSARPPETGQALRDWLAQGHHGEMAYLARNAPRRLDPALVLADAKSVIVLAASYGPSEHGKDFPAPPTVNQPMASPCENSATRGVVARYARYVDYHTVVGEKLKELTAYVDQLGQPSNRSLWYVDTGPILERDLAQRAGLGFVGKHTNLIGRDLGNWFFIAEILTTLVLEPDSPERNRCGSCTSCIHACPTQAITGPFQLDARRCVSYLTIELKGSIPVELRRAIGNRIYGCDDCLAVCPWNRFARAGRLMQARGREGLAEPDLIELLSLDEAGFKSRFADTPILRSKRKGLLRNVCVALGNIGQPEALPALRKAASDPEPLIAEHAVWAIGEIERRVVES